MISNKKNNTIIEVDERNSANQAANEKVICSHHIMKELNRAIPELAYAILHDESMPNLDF